MVKVGDFADFDLDRGDRTGIPEVVLAEGKTDEHLHAIVEAVLDRTDRVIVSRIDASRVGLLEGEGRMVHHHAAARLAIIARVGADVPRHDGCIGVLAAGTADVAVAEEARLFAEAMGFRTFHAYDVGVAGLHRLFPALEAARAAGVDVLVVAAGREGALPTVVAGLVDVPVIGLPVSTGYGVAGRGEAALHAMLQSCAPLSVVNIDAGVVAGAVASQIARRAASLRAREAPTEVRA